jgi:hypothetical protein
MRGPRPPVWQPEDLADLLRLYAAGLPIAEVAQRLGRTESACNIRMTILRRRGAAGMPPRRNQPVPYQASDSPPPEETSA